MRELAGGGVPPRMTTTASGAATSSPSLRPRALLLMLGGIGGILSCFVVPWFAGDGETIFAGRLDETTRFGGNDLLSPLPLALTGSIGLVLVGLAWLVAGLVAPRMTPAQEAGLASLAAIPLSLAAWGGARGVGIAFQWLSGGAGVVSPAGIVLCVLALLLLAVVAPFVGRAARGAGAATSLGTITAIVHAMAPWQVGEDGAAWAVFRVESGRGFVGALSLPDALVGASIHAFGAAAFLLALSSALPHGRARRVCVASATAGGLLPATLLLAGAARPLGATFSAWFSHGEGASSGFVSPAGIALSILAVVALWAAARRAFERSEGEVAAKLAIGAVLAGAAALFAISAIPWIAIDLGTEDLHVHELAIAGGIGGDSRGEGPVRVGLALIRHGVLWPTLVAHIAVAGALLRPHVRAAGVSLSLANVAAPLGGIVVLVGHIVFFVGIGQLNDANGSFGDTAFSWRPNYFATPLAIAFVALAVAALAASLRGSGDLFATLLAPPRPDAGANDGRGEEPVRRLPVRTPGAPPVDAPGLPRGATYRKIDQARDHVRVIVDRSARSARMSQWAAQMETYLAALEDRARDARDATELARIQRDLDVHVLSIQVER